MFVTFGVVTFVAIALHQTISYFKMEMDWPSFIFAAGGSLVIRDVFPNKNLTNLGEVREFFEGIAFSSICQEFKDLAKVRCPPNGNGKNKRKEEEVTEELEEWHPNLLPLVSKVLDHTISDHISVRIYYPHDVNEKEGVASLLWLHGGGFVLGGIEMDDRKASILANQTEQVAVVSVAYSLAPEAPYPAAVNDAHEALNWLLYAEEALRKFNLRPDQVFIGGESSGGTLAAAAVAMKEVADLDKDVEHKVAIKGMLLIYPPLDRNYTTESYVKFANVNGALSARQMKWFWDLYVNEEGYSGHNSDIITATQHPPPSPPSRYCNDFDYKLCPLLTPSHVLQGNSFWPPTWLHLAKYDVLYSEGKAYADRLMSYGQHVEVLEYKNSVHGFFFERIFPDSNGAIRLAASQIVRVLREGKGKEQEQEVRKR